MIPAKHTHYLILPPLPTLTEHTTPLLLLYLMSRGGAVLVGPAGFTDRQLLAGLLGDGALAELLGDVTRPIRMSGFAHGYVFEEL
jgi:hypothetical protein